MQALQLCAAQTPVFNNIYEGDFMATEHVIHDKLEQTSNPVAPLALIVLPSAEKLGEKIKIQTPQYEQVQE